MLKNVHAIIFRVKIFSYASRPYENILTTKIFNNENLEHKVAQPLLLILVIYALVCLYDRNFKPLVLVWRPFGAIILCFRKQFDVRHSLIHAFASFFLLYFFSFSATSYSFIHRSYLHPINYSSKISTIFYWDGSDTSTNISVLTFTMLIVLAILPIMLMLVYPTRTFQKCLNCCGLRCLPLHIFMDAFQGCYKNGTDGTRDYRYFAGLYLVFRYLAFIDSLHYFITHHLNPDGERGLRKDPHGRNIFSANNNTTNNTNIPPVTFSEACRGFVMDTLKRRVETLEAIVAKAEVCL